MISLSCFSFAGVCSASAQDENGVAPTQCTNLYVAPILPPVTLAQDGQEMDNVGHHANPHVAAPTCESDLQDTNHALHVSSDEDRAPPPAGPHPEHEVETNVPNQSANFYVVAPIKVAQDEQGMDSVIQRGNSNDNTPLNPLVEPAQSANVPPTGEGDVHPKQDEQQRTAANNQLGDGVGDGSPQPHAPNSDSPSLDKEQHFVPRRGSHSSHNDPDVRRESKPTPISPLVRVVAASSQSPRSPTKKRRFSFPSKRQSLVENGEEKKLLELPKTPKSLSHRRQSKSENDEERNLLKEQSPVDEEHPTIGDGHTSDDQ